MKKKQWFDPETVIPKLEGLVGQPMKYNQLCKALNIKTTTGGSKQNQLDELRLYCDIFLSNDPTTYTITNIYPEAVAFLQKINGNDKFQLYFETLVYKKFKANDFRPVHLSNMEILRLFEEINVNFPYAMNDEAIKAIDIVKGEDISYFMDMAKIVYRILLQWAKRRLKVMSIRGVVALSDGFRLYSIDPRTGHQIKYDVQEGTELFSWCISIYGQAVIDIMPPKWAGEWVAEWQWRRFEKRLSELTEERSEGKYCNIKKILTITPPTKEWFKEMLIKQYEQLSVEAQTNKESQRKISSTTQLDEYTGAERKKFIEYTIDLHPPFFFLEILRQLQEKPAKD